jgi:uncharacterized protein (DUF58 family)
VEALTSIDPQTLAKIQGLRLRARHIVEGYVAGLHRSPYRGFSTEFTEHREYAPGDDLRYVDWKVYGRRDKVYLKQYEDETNLSCYLVLDVSESMTYRGPGAALSKLDYAQSLAAALGWLVLRQQDAVGLATFDDQVRTLLRPGGTPSQLNDLLRALEEVQPTSTTAAGSIFHELAQRLTRRGVVVILSDCFDDVAAIAAGLKHFKYRRHDVTLLHVLDPAEMDFPFRSPLEFQGLEAMPGIDAEPRRIRAAYLREFNAFRQSLEQACRREQVDYFLLRTDQSLDSALTRILSRRRAKSP